MTGDEPWESWPRVTGYASRVSVCSVCSKNIWEGNRIARLGKWTWVHEYHAEYETKKRRWESRYPDQYPFVVKPLKGKVEVNLPLPGCDPEIDVMMLRKAAGARILPAWKESRWNIAREQYVNTVNGLALMFGKCYVDQYHTKAQRCDKRCQDALGYECICCCCFRNHGAAVTARPGSYLDPLSMWQEDGEHKLVSNLIMVVHYIVAPVEE